MSNHFGEQVDAGLQTLVQQQGKSGIPAAPDTASRPTIPTDSESAPSAADAQDELDAGRKQAEQALEQEKGFGLEDTSSEQGSAGSTVQNP